MAKLTPEEQTTVETYDREAVEWTETHSEPKFWAKEVGEFATFLSGGKVLEIGAGGSGRDARLLVAVGFEYVGTDISLKMLEEARKRNPRLTYEHKSIYDLDYPPESFDGFWMSNTLHHVPRQRLPEALQSVHRVVKPGAVGFISVKEGEGEEMFSEVSEAEVTGSYQRLFTYFKEGSLRKLLESNGFEVIKFKRYPPGTHIVLNKKATWLVAFVRRKPT